MRIEKIEGCDFPITIVCDGENCGTTFTVTMPEDMRRVGVWRRSLVDNVSQPQKIRERVLTKCPCCGYEYEVAMYRMSKKLLEKIPYDRTDDPVGTPAKYVGYMTEGFD